MNTPWLIYLALLATLAVAERFTQPEAAGLDRGLDLAINGVAFFGLLAAAVWSVVAARALSRSRHRDLPVGRLLAAGFAAPLVATVAVTYLSQDVDGALWMIFSPALGLAVVGILCLLAIVDARRKKPRGPHRPV